LSFKINPNLAFGARAFWNLQHFDEQYHSLSYKITSTWEKIFMIFRIKHFQIVNYSLSFWKNHILANFNHHDRFSKGIYCKMANYDPNEESDYYYFIRFNHTWMDHAYVKNLNIFSDECFISITQSVVGWKKHEGDNFEVFELISQKIHVSAQFSHISKMLLINTRPIPENWIVPFSS
jgi:hypothetical protein